MRATGMSQCGFVSIITQHAAPLLQVGWTLCQTRTMMTGLPQAAPRLPQSGTLSALARP
jgi:hypothetical protein